MIHKKDNNDQSFKDVLYFPSLSTGLGPYMKKKKILVGDLDYKFFSDSYPKEWQHPYFLITAGHFYKEENYRKELGLEDTYIMGDSGGFQIASGAIPYTKDIVSKIFHWLENNSDLAVNLDIPPRMKYNGKFRECLDISIENYKYFADNQTGKTKFLNVVHGYNDVEQYKIWYEAVKDFPFNGWCAGSGGGSLERTVYVFALLMQKGEFRKPNIQILHFLGQTKAFDYLLFNSMQKALDINGMDHVQVTTDSSTPVMYTLFGNVIHGLDLKAMSYRIMSVPKPKEGEPVLNSKNFPCPINCPICQTVDYSKMDKYSTLATHVFSMHNLFMFISMQKELKQLIDCDIVLLDQIIDKDYINVFKSIEQMGKHPDKALDIFKKNQQLYIKLSNKIQPPIESQNFTENFE